jgi:RNA polymerase sigma-70 factor (ECF subfamily)
LVPELSDEALLQNFIAGDAECFDALMRRHEDRIFALASRMTGNRHDALDATQDAFIAAFRNAKKFKGNAAFSTWLYRIAINSCTDLLRRKKRLVPTEEIEVPNPGHVLDHGVSLRVDLERALDQLTPHHREAVMLHDVGGFPYEDIAAVTGVELGTVKSRISRGRRKLAVLLEQPGGREPSKETT